MLSQVFERFVESTPVSVMARAAMEHALGCEDVDALFRRKAQGQYTKELLFSSVVDLMGVVVCKVQPSMHAAFQRVAKTLPVSITSLYNKLNGTEPAIASALAHHTAERLAPVIVAMGGQLPPLLRGYRVRILDGNHLAATQRRLKVLRGSVAGPLPGHALVVLDPQLMLATHMIPCEDGHAQERSLSGSILDLVDTNDVWVADRNFCTSQLLFGIADKGGFFVIRRHANTTFLSEGTLRRCGRTETGEVFERSVSIADSHGNTRKVRQAIVRLDKPTRNGDTEMSVLTNLPKNAADAIALVELYRKRWTLETMFQSLAKMLHGEIDTLAYPRAALLGFAVALAAYNIFSTVHAALRAQFGVEKVQEEVSGFYIANEVRSTTVGMSIALGADAWDYFSALPPHALARHMLAWAACVQLPQFKRHPRGPKKPVPKRTTFLTETHVSTARLLQNARKK